jgi:hypothetical protein
LTSRQRDRLPRLRFPAVFSSPQAYPGTMSPPLLLSASNCGIWRYIIWANE